MTKCKDGIIRSRSIYLWRKASKTLLKERQEARMERRRLRSVVACSKWWAVRQTAMITKPTMAQTMYRLNDLPPKGLLSQRQKATSGDVTIPAVAKDGPQPNPLNQHTLNSQEDRTRSALLILRVPIAAAPVVFDCRASISK